LGIMHTSSLSRSCARYQRVVMQIVLATTKPINHAANRGETKPSWPLKNLKSLLSRRHLLLQCLRRCVHLFVNYRWVVSSQDAHWVSQLTRSHHSFLSSTTPLWLFRHRKRFSPFCCAMTRFFGYPLESSLPFCFLPA